MAGLLLLIVLVLGAAAATATAQHPSEGNADRDRDPDAIVGDTPNYKKPNDCRKPGGGVAGKSVPCTKRAKPTMCFHSGMKVPCPGTKLYCKQRLKDPGLFDKVKLVPCKRRAERGQLGPKTRCMMASPYDDGQRTLKGVFIGEERYGINVPCPGAKPECFKEANNGVKGDYRRVDCRDPHPDQCKRSGVVVPCRKKGGLQCWARGVTLGGRGDPVDCTAAAKPEICERGGVRVSCPGTGKGPCKGYSVNCMIEQSAAKLFGEDQSWGTSQLLEWLIRVPNLTEQKDGKSKGKIAQVSELTRAVAFALLAALITFAVFQFWAVGMTSQGGATVLFDAVARSAGAGLFILAWPWLFASGFELSEALRHVFMTGAQLNEATLSFWAALGTAGVLTPVAGGVPFIIMILIGLAFVLLNLSLFITKLGLTAGLLVAYAVMPIVAALWVIPATSAPAAYAARFCAAVASTQVMWALCIRLFAVLVNEPLWGGAGAWTDELGKPLFAMAMLGVMLAIPRHTFRAWGLDKAGGNPFGAAVSMAVGGMMRSAIARHVPDAAGGQKDTLRQRAEDRKLKAEDRARGLARDAKNDARNEAQDTRKKQEQYGANRHAEYSWEQQRLIQEGHGRKDLQQKGGPPKPVSLVKSSGTSPAAGGATPVSLVKASSPSAGAAAGPVPGKNGLPDGGRSPEAFLEGKKQDILPAAIKGVEHQQLIQSAEVLKRHGWWEPARSVIGDGGGAPRSSSDMRITDTLTRAHQAENLEPEVKDGFKFWAAASPDGRRYTLEQMGELPKGAKP